MKINQPSFEIWEQMPGIDGVYKQIERAGRVCYKSENHLTTDSARPFCERMIKSEHFAMLEHGTIYLAIDVHDIANSSYRDFYLTNHFSYCKEIKNIIYITTNLRVLAENNRMDDLKFQVEATENHERRVTVHFSTQVAITREYNRHRVNSIAEQSTRYCNYSKEKFGNELTVNIPTWITDAEQNHYTQQIQKGEIEVDSKQMFDLYNKVMEGTATDVENWLFANLSAERAYMNLISNGHKAQEARVILPLDVNTELVHTAFIKDWKHFFDLRALDKTGAAHPDAKILALPLYHEFQRLGMIE